MANHRAPSWVPEQFQHVGWGTLFLLVLLGLSGVVVGFMCCVGWLIGG